MPLYVGDYLKDTRHLTAEQHGAYLLVLMDLWNRGGSISDDPKALARIAGVSVKRWPAVWSVIGEFFDCADGRVSHGRITSELQKADQISQKRKTAGSKGGTAKALKEQDRDLANAKQLPEQMLWQTHSRSEPSIEKKDSEAKASDAGASEPVSVKTQIWAVGRPMFEKAGTDKKAAGAVIGALIKRKGEVEALTIITALRADTPMDPEQYLWAIIHGKQALATDVGAAPQLELVLIDGKPVMQPIGRRAA
jgi:uncharacterized protein YdaU (DUF1376 family)